MCSTREEITEAFASLATALSRVLGLTFDALTTPERLALLEHCETARRQLPSVEHTLINQIGEQSTEEELGGKLAHREVDPGAAFRQRDHGQRAELGVRQPARPQRAIIGLAELSGRPPGGVASAFVERRPFAHYSRLV